MIALIGNHLWQSTLFAVACGLLTLALRTNRAQVRHGLWLAASLKFFVPFAMLMALGGQVRWRIAAPTASRVEVRVVMDALSQPFSQSPLRVAAAGTPEALPQGLAGSLAPILLAIWIAGGMVLAIAWGLKWRRVARVAREAERVTHGRELNILRRLEQIRGIPTPTPLLSSSAPMEPGVFGILRPVLLWPSGISACLDDQQIEAIMTHELSHVRRRDNLAALVHMAVQAVFWFHPLVWWVGARLVDERERACDEDVIHHGSVPEVYAESILKTCRFSIESPLTCVAGVTGSNLTKRIETIMSGRAGRGLRASQRAMLGVAAAAAVSTPLIAGALHAPTLEARAVTFVQRVAPGAGRALMQAPTAAQGAANPTFEVASVKPNKSGDGRVMIGMQPGGRFTASNVPLRMLIRMAYQLQDFQVIGGPDWMDSDRFDISAKAEGDVPPAPPGTTGPMQLMMRSLLSERFTLAAHQEQRELPIYALVVARSDGKLGAQLRPSTVDCQALMRERGRGGPPAPPQPGQRLQCGMRIGPGTMAGGGFPLSQLASTLSPFVQRVVVDRTGLAGVFDLDLTWTPDQMAQGQRPPGAPEPPAIDPNGPSLFTAIQEQLGLKLESTKGPVDVLVIDRVAPPTPD